LPSKITAAGSDGADGAARAAEFQRWAGVGGVWPLVSVQDHPDPFERLNDSVVVVLIETIAGLLQALQVKEERLLGAQQIGHPSTIGAMYEGLTRSLLSTALPAGVQLHVLSGFVSNEEGTNSRQVDCMITTSPGVAIPYTEDRLVPFADVVAVVEVKKNLYSNELRGAYENLLSVKSVNESRALRKALLDRAFRSVARSPLPAETDVSRLPTHSRLVYGSLVSDWQLPVRVVFGYHGFKTEASLRRGLVSFLEQNLDTPGYDPQSLPSLIIAGRSSLVKLNGMPYNAWRQPDEWMLYASSRHNPLLILMEVLYARLTYIHGMGHDLLTGLYRLESMNLLLSARGIQDDDKTGWHYSYLGSSSDSIDAAPVSDSWKPAVLNEIEHSVLALMSEHGPDPLPASHEQLLMCLDSWGVTLGEVAEGLRIKGIAVEHDGELHYLTNQLAIGYLPDGRVVAGENVSDELESWIVSGSWRDGSDQKPGTS